MYYIGYLYSELVHISRSINCVSRYQPWTWDFKPGVFWYSVNITQISQYYLYSLINPRSRSAEVDQESNNLCILMWYFTWIWIKISVSMPLFKFRQSWSKGPSVYYITPPSTPLFSYQNRFTSKVLSLKSQLNLTWNFLAATQGEANIDTHFLKVWLSFRWQLRCWRALPAWVPMASHSL